MIGIFVNRFKMGLINVQDLDALRAWKALM